MLSFIPMFTARRTAPFTTPLQLSGMLDMLIISCEEHTHQSVALNRLISVLSAYRLLISLNRYGLSAKPPARKIFWHRKVRSMELVVEVIAKGYKAYSYLARATSIWRMLDFSNLLPDQLHGSRYTRLKKRLEFISTHCQRFLHRK